MTKRTIRWTALLLVATSGICQAADSDTERIRKLEEKVQQLESMLRGVIAAQQNQGAVADSLRNVLEGGGTPDPNKQAAEPEAVLPKNRARELPQELLPNLGKIGATANFVTATGLGEDGFLRNRFYGGSLSLPVLNVPGGKLSYEVAIGVLNFDRPSRQERRQILELIPFGLQYAPAIWEGARLRPFVAAGLGNYVVLTSSPAAGAGLHVGARLGAGLEWRVLRDVGVAIDVHHNWANNGLSYTTIGPRASWHF